MSSRKRLNVHEKISYLEEDSPIISADIFITPPENVDFSDEDSGSEDSGHITEVRCQVPSSEGILETVEGIPCIYRDMEDRNNGQDEQENQPSTSSSAEPPGKKAKIVLEQESTVPDFVLDKDNPLEFFEIFFDDEVYEMVRPSTEKNAIAKGQINFRLTIEEVKNFIGILLLSGYNSASRYRLYWDQSIDTHHPGVASCYATFTLVIIVSSILMTNLRK
ncbi:hypothetical protein ABMA27_010460 [Loxostege sticticalis]|uniref:PiggyBac transposable element-derived protein domain-containing protein n=1 Tax=Loxostege sticticalis TaxID=481309 RepID=A0ABR3H5S9_LOXSC